MTNEKLNNVIALVISVAGLLFAAFSLYIAYLSYEEQKRDNRLDELISVIALDAEKLERYVKNRALIED